MTNVKEYLLKLKELEDFKEKLENHIELDKTDHDPHYLRYYFKKPLKFILDHGKAIITVDRLDINSLPRPNFIFVDYGNKKVNSVYEASLDKINSIKLG
ncbi:MAG: hypothetical protein LBM02_08135 [Lachnospiraceae bacterium]|jgi:hypothetical protein|nr:hypothetical protein [Lachnospiraceae bacterium]